MQHQLGFNQPADYHGLFRHYGGYYRRFLDLIAQAGAIDPSVLLDLACGVGDFTELLALRFPRARIHGLDVSPTYIDYAIAHHTSGRTSYWAGPAQTLPGLAWAGEIDTIFIKGSYHLFEDAVPLRRFQHPAFRSLKSVIVIEKTARSLETYPVPPSAAQKRGAYVSPELIQRRTSTPSGIAVSSVSYGEVIEIPVEDYLQAVGSRQFSYLDVVSDEELAAWLAEMVDQAPLRLFEENVANIYQLK